MGVNPWVKRQLYKSPKGATYVSMLGKKLREILCRPSRGLMIDFIQVPGLTPEATTCRHYRGFDSSAKDLEQRGIRRIDSRRLAVFLLLSFFHFNDVVC